MAIFKGLMWNIHNSHFYLFKFDHPNKKNLKKKRRKKKKQRQTPPKKKQTQNPTGNGSLFTIRGDYY